MSSDRVRTIWVATKVLITDSNQDTQLDSLLREVSAEIWANLSPKIICRQDPLLILLSRIQIFRSKAQLCVSRDSPITLQDTHRSGTSTWRVLLDLKMLHTVWNRLYQVPMVSMKLATLKNQALQIGEYHTMRDILIKRATPRFLTTTDKWAIMIWGFPLDLMRESTE